MMRVLDENWFRKFKRRPLIPLVLVALLIFGTAVTFYQASQSKLHQLKQEAASNDFPVLSRVELASNQGAGDGQGNGWGPHNTRIVRNSNGDIYTVMTIPDPTQQSNIYYKYWRLAKRDASSGTWSVYLPQGADGKDVFTAPNILRGPQDQIYVLSTPNMLPKMWSSDSNSEISVPGTWYINPRLQTGTQEGTHAAAGITPSGSIYFTKYRAIGCAGAEIPGAYDLSFTQPGGQNWTFRTNTIFPGDQDNSSCQNQLPPFEHGRYEYQFVVPNSQNQMEMVGSLDLTSTEYGYPRANNNVDYYFNGIGIFNLANPSAQPPPPVLLPVGGVSPTTYHLDGTNDTNIRFDARDVYIDTQNRTHILYDLNRTGSFGARHAVVQNGQVIADVPLIINYNDKAKIIQDTAGQFFIISAGPGSDGKSCSLYIQKGLDTDTDGTNLSSVQELGLATASKQTFDCSTIQNHFIAAPRSGTPLADYVDGMVAANYGIDWVYYRLNLHGGSGSTITPTPTGLTTSTSPSPTSIVTSSATGTISISPSTGSYSVGDTIDTYVVIQADSNFATAKATVSISSNLKILSISPPPAAFGPCNFDRYVTNPTTSNPSFDVVYNAGRASNSCTIYKMSLQVVGTGSGTVSVSNGLITLSSSGTVVPTNSPASFTLISPTPVPFTPTNTPLVILNSADLNKDGLVNIFDLSILLSNFATANAIADINTDGTVNIFDLSILLSNFGK